MVRKVIARMILAERMTLVVINCKLISGDSDLLSMITNNTNEMDPKDRRAIFCGLILVFSPEYDNALTF